MKTLPNVGDLVVVNNLPDATHYRVVETSGKYWVGLIDSTIEKQYPNQVVQRCGRDMIQYPTKKQLRNRY